MATARWTFIEARAWSAPALFLLVVSQPAAGQQAVCDQGLKPNAASPYAYGPRGDRCEGVYVKQVGGTLLTIVSLTSSFEKYDFASGRKVRFEWQAFGDSGVRIRVRGIRPQLYYGMDASRPPGAESYEWPTGILSSLRIGQPDIGALAWTRRKVGSVWRRVYIPLHITQSGPAGATNGYVLALYPGVKLQEVYLTLGAADSAGRPIEGMLIKDHEPLEHGFYPAERPIRIRIPRLEPPGLYYVEVSATLPDGAPVSVAPFLIDTGGS